VSRELGITEGITTCNRSIKHVRMWGGNVYLLPKERTIWQVLLKFGINIVPFSTSRSKI
jgi:hypothetical protein